jgi:hypothetical protein
MLKRMILAGLLASTAVPVLASQASYETNAPSVQSATTTTASTPAAPKHDCSCECNKHHS